MNYKSKKKVAFMVSSMDTGGAQRMVSNIITHFPDEWDIDLILNSSENIIYPYKGHIIDLNVKEPKNRISLIYQGIVFIKRIKVLHKLKKQKHYQAVISFLDSANIANILTGNKYCKTIVSVRSRLSGETSKVYKVIVNNLVKLLYNHADKIVAISEGVREDLQNNFHINPHKLCTIYNGYDIQSIMDLAASGKLDEDIQKNLKEKTVILNVGRMDHLKGQWHLLKAFSLLADSHKNLRLLIIGNGNLQYLLKNLCKELKIENKVIFTGFLENPFPLYKNASIFVFPSICEGFGNALVEAMICGLPCIATDFKYGAREILDPSLDISESTDNIIYGEYGIISPNCEILEESMKCNITDNEKKLAEAIDKLLIDKQLQTHYSKRAEERAKMFHIDNTVKEWIDLIEK